MVVKIFIKTGFTILFHCYLLGICSGEKGEKSEEQAIRTRYLLYDVNPGEGFNLRRDVYMRMANMVNLFNEQSNDSWILVLPPWGRIYHWKSRWLTQSKVRWSHFFDLASFNKHAPVVEFEDFLSHFQAADDNPIVVGDAIYLQRYEEGWIDGKWTTRADFRPCLDEMHEFAKDAEDRWRWWFWGYDSHVVARNFRCLSIQMAYADFAPILSNNITSSTVFVNRAETLSHGRYSEWSAVWWTARRSMRFAQHLRDIADNFRRKYLDSTDTADETVLEPDWTKMRRQHGDAKGGPYLATHLRRQDFARAHRIDVPSLAYAAKQVRAKMEELQLNTVFVATDGTKEEFAEFQQHLADYRVLRFEPSEDLHEELLDGGVAIIDQWICAHARYFIGTSVSTFTFRIHEEREILGFAPEMTYNRYCGDEQGETCEQPTKWACKYE